MSVHSLGLPGYEEALNMERPSPGPHAGGIDSRPMPGGPSGESEGACSQQDKMHHIKRPLNLFMLYMNEMRPKIVAEFPLIESADINKILSIRVGCRAVNGSPARLLSAPGSSIP